jgi:uncharacterized protein
VTEETTSDGGSPFHPGEREMQARAGMRERIESFGRRIIRDHMTDQHRTFFTQLPLFFVASLDARQRPWASVLWGPPGFLQSPDPRRLEVTARPFAGDVLNETLRDGAALGGLGIEFHTRRRNRVNGIATLAPSGGSFAIRVKESFGNCAKYIQARLHRGLPTSAPTSAPRVVRRLREIDATARAIIERADTFFIASHYAGAADAPAESVDLSHRGGRRGFVRMPDERSLLWPDYRGNFLFNTLGNILADPKCGLLFLDFDTGSILQLTGEAQILWDWPCDAPELKGAERLVSFRLDEGRLIEEIVPLTWDFLGLAPQFIENAGGQPGVTSISS